MFKSPKRTLVLITLFGFGLGLLYVLVTDRQIAILATSISSILVGAVWAGWLLLVRWWRNGSNGKDFNIAWFWVFYFFFVVAIPLGCGLEAAFALGGYGFVLLMAVQIREWHHGKPVSWQDLRSHENASGMENRS